jgi:DNA gyrase inhibitor GyrI
MPLPEVRRVLAATSEAERDRVLTGHLQRMEGERTRAIVASLRHLLSAPDQAATVVHRSLPDQTAVAVTVTVGVAPAGPGSATYGEAFFTDGAGEVTAFVPVAEPTPFLPATIIPGGRFAVAVHVGAFRELDRTYAALGSHVAEHDQVRPGPVRERYLVGPPETQAESDFRTEVCWPISA